MIQDQLRLLLIKNSSQSNPLYLRTQLKEVLQDYVLNFIYNDKDYKELIFTGGTCLRKIYGLPRLSEDLDFDFTNSFDLSSFSQDIETYFGQKVQYKNVETKITNNNNSVFIKFPTLLKEIEASNDQVGSSTIFLRCDFSKDTLSSTQTEINSISSSNFTFFVRSYDLPTLFANKICAVLTREFFKGKNQSIPFKGRDIFDLDWFFSQSIKSGGKIQPNWERISAKFPNTSKDQILTRLMEKIKTIKQNSRSKDIYTDLLPFIASSRTAESFSDNFIELLETKIRNFSTG